MVVSLHQRSHRFQVCLRIFKSYLDITVHYIPSTN